LTPGSAEVEACRGMQGGRVVKVSETPKPRFYLPNGTLEYSEKATIIQ